MVWMLLCRCRSRFLVWCWLICVCCVWMVWSWCVILSCMNVFFWFWWCWLVFICWWLVCVFLWLLFFCLNFVWLIICLGWLLVFCVNMCKVRFSGVFRCKVFVSFYDFICRYFLYNVVIMESIFMFVAGFGVRFWRGSGDVLVVIKIGFVWNIRVMKVFIVESDFDWCNMLSVYVGELGYEILVCLVLG